MYPRKIKGANVLYGQPRDEASPRPRVSHQQEKECYGSSQDPRISGLHNQYLDHEDFTAAIEGKQITTENQATGEEYNAVIPMDSLVTGQNHCGNPGRIRSTFAYSPHTERPGDPE